MRNKILLITIIVILAGSFMWRLTVKAQDEDSEVVSYDYYRDIEELYKNNLRNKLDGLGFKNAGITMTRVYLSENELEYTVLIHHKKIDRMSDLEKELLLKNIEVLRLEVEQCKFQEIFLDYDS